MNLPGIEAAVSIYIGRNLIMWSNHVAYSLYCYCDVSKAEKRDRDICVLVVSPDASQLRWQRRTDLSSSWRLSSSGRNKLAKAGKIIDILAPRRIEEAGGR